MKGVRPSSCLLREAPSLLAVPVPIPVDDFLKSSAAELFPFRVDFLLDVLAFWVAEFGGQDRLAPAFWVMLGHARFEPLRAQR